MLWYVNEGDSGSIFLGALIGLLVGAACAAGPLAIGLSRGQQMLAWIGVAITVFFGLILSFVAILPAGGFVAYLLMTPPLERKRGRRHNRRPRLDRNWADNYAYEARKRRFRESEDRPRERELDDRPEIVDEVELERAPEPKVAPRPAVHPVLAEVRRQMGQPPRLFSESELKAISIPAPRWLADDELSIVGRDQRAVLTLGEVFWGAIVRADPALARPGPLDHPATIVYSRDPAIIRDPELLTALAARVQHLSSVDRRVFNREVPSDITGGMAVYLTTVLVGRIHVPYRVLVGPLVPIVIRYDTPAALIGPMRFWPTEFRKPWEEEAKSRVAARPTLTLAPPAIDLLRRLAVAKNFEGDWCLRVRIDRDVDGSNVEIQHKLAPLDLDPVRDRQFRGGGVVVALPTDQIEELRGLEIGVEVVGGKERLVIR